MSWLYVNSSPLYASVFILKLTFTVVSKDSCLPRCYSEFNTLVDAGLDAFSQHCDSLIASF